MDRTGLEWKKIFSIRSRSTRQIFSLIQSDPCR